MKKLTITPTEPTENVGIDLHGISLSASGVASLLPVLLDEKSDDAIRYSQIFYPPKSVPKGNRYYVERKYYFDFLTYLSALSSNVNCIFSQLRYMVHEGQFVDHVEKDRDFVGRYNQSHEAMSKGTEEEQKRKKDPIVEVAKLFCITLSSGNVHIIKPSATQPGGYDVIYSGIPGTGIGAGKGSGLCAPALLGTNAIGQNVRGLVYTTPYAKEGLSLAKGLIQVLMNDNKTTALSNTFAHKRHQAVLPIDTDIKGLIVSLFKSSSLDVVDLGNFPVVPAHLAKVFKGVFSILVQIEPNNAQVARAYAGKPVDNAEDQEVTDEYLAMHPNLSFSIVMHLPKTIVDYITQTPPGGKVSLAALNTWASVWSRGLLRVPKSTRDISIQNIPKYVVPASAVVTLIEGRKKLGYASDTGRSNTDGIFVSNTGRLNYCPSSEQLALDNALGYESIIEEALQMSYDAGSPLHLSQSGETHPVFSLNNPEYRANIGKVKENIGKYAGSLQSYNWDYNCILASQKGNPERLDDITLAGASTPNDLSLSQYLRMPFCDGMAILFKGSTEGKVEGRAVQLSADTFGKRGGGAGNFVYTSIFKNMYILYANLLQKGIVPSVQELIYQSAKELGIKELSLPKFGTKVDGNEEYERGLYTSILTLQLDLTPNYSPRGTPLQVLQTNVRAIGALLLAALGDAIGTNRTNLYLISQREGMEVYDNSRYFSPSENGLDDFKNVYAYLGGRVFLKVLQAIQKVPVKDLFVVDTSLEGGPNDTPNCSALVKEVMPMVYILGKYVINSEQIHESARLLEEANQVKDDIDEEDLKIPGSLPTLQYFPHALEAQKRLRGTPPKFAILDIAPGGGKTIQLLTDIAILVGQGLVKKPIVLAPDGLIKNWYEDMKIVAGTSWNIILLNTKVYTSDYWGDERLSKLIKEAPRNTIVVSGFEILKRDSYPVVIGTHVEPVSGGLEFLKKFGFDYIAVDECHKAKNPKSLLNKAMKQLCVAPWVKYIRLASGTLISNTLVDIVGQAGLFNSQIFRTADEWQEENQQQAPDGRAMMWKPDTGAQARRQLAKFCAVMTFKRKHWAFLLPVPIETFIKVDMEKIGDVETLGGKAHRLAYEAVLKETLDSIKADADLKKVLADEESDDDDDDDGKKPSATTGEADLDVATEAELLMKLNPYLARLEQILTDPLGDEFCELYFAGIDKGFVSHKVLEVIKRIRKHYNVVQWSKGGIYKPKDLAEFDGIQYVLMVPEGSKLTREVLSTKYTSTISPSKDPRWKVEPRGKIIIVCRFTRTCNAIYNALPADLKATAVRYHGALAKEGGEDKDKIASLNAFKKIPVGGAKAQILIANEQGMSEGHNLQMASRIIRVESPWAPGNLDQTAARIFRPDPSGKFSRENIYLDWLVTDGTLEVNKMYRLISKMISNTQFDEAGNPLYSELNDISLPLVKMGIPMLQEIMYMPDQEQVDKGDPKAEYISTYQLMCTTQAQEFKEMRSTYRTSMVPIPTTEMFADAAPIEFTPFIDGLDVMDRHGYGLQTISDYLDNASTDEAYAIVKDKRLLIGKYVRTEVGNGVISSVRLGADIPGHPRKLSSVSVTLASGENYSSSPQMVHLAANIDESNVGKFTPAGKWVNKTEQRHLEKLARQQEREEAKAAKEELKAAAREEKEAAKQKAREAIRQAAAGGGTSRTRPKVPLPVVEEESDVMLYKVIYNGFLALEADLMVVSPKTAKALKAQGFSNYGQYAWIAVPTYGNYDAITKYLKSKYTLDARTIARLDAAGKSFKTIRPGSAFVAELAPASEFAQFYAETHRAVRVDTTVKKPPLKVYPVIRDGMLLFNIDWNTNPAVAKLVNKSIPGTTLKFQDASEMYIKFCPKHNDLVATIKAIKADPLIHFNKEDYAALAEEVNASKFKQGMR